MKPTSSIRGRIALLLGAASVMAALAAAYAVYSDYQLARQQEENRLAEVVELAAAGIRQFVDDTERTLVGIAGRPAIRSMDPATCQVFAREANEVLHAYTNVFVVDLEGDVVCSALPTREPVPSAEGSAWWEKRRASEDFVVGSPQFGRISQAPVLVFAHRIRDDAGEPVGWVGVAANTVVRFRDLVSTSNVTEGGIITLAEYDGTVISRTEDAEDWVGRDLPGAADGEDHSLVERGSNVAPDADGVTRFWTYRNLPRYQWRVYAGVPLARVRAAAASRARPKVLVLLSLLALLLISVVRLQGTVTGALDELRRATRAAALGRTDAVPVSGPHEVAEVATQFNRTLEDRTRALASERRIRHRYQSVMNNAVFGIFISTPDGRILEANPALARMLRFESAAHVMSSDMNDFYARASDRAELVGEALHAERSAAEVEWRRADGSTFPVRLNWSRIRLPDGADAFEVIAEDLTERRALEQQLRQAQKLEAVGRLAGGVAHDFNNRLTVISGQAELLLAELGDDDGLREHAEAIMASARRAADLTAQLLAFSRRQANRPEALDLVGVVSGVETMIRRLVGEDVEVVTDLEEVGAVRADPGQIEQILLNLCTNARDAMPDGGRLTLATESRSLTPEAARTQVDALPGDYAVLVVTDTGHGMDAETRQHVFEPFFTTKPPGKGTGLGLSTVYGITVQAGGHVRVYSWPSKGTRFEIWLPKAPDALSSEGESDAAAEALPAPGGGETILVAEDEEPVRRILTKTLARAGYEVLEAPDGPRALALARERDGPIHLLLTDVVMPGMRGPELASRLTRARPGTRVLFISGYADDAALEPDVDELLPKPFTPEELRARVRSILDAEAGIHPAG